MVLPGVGREEIRTVHSHIHALGQCRKIVRANGWKPGGRGRYGRAAKLVKEVGDRSMAALARALPADPLRLDIIARTSRTPTATSRASWCCPERRAGLPAPRRTN